MKRAGPSCFGRHLPGLCASKSGWAGEDGPLTSRKPRAEPQMHHDVSWGHMRGGASRDVHLQSRLKMSLLSLARYVALTSRGITRDMDGSGPDEAGTVPCPRPQ